MQKSRRGTSDDGTTVTAAHLWNLLISYEIRANHIYLPFDLRDKRNRSAINTEWNKILRLFTLSVNIDLDESIDRLVESWIYLQTRIIRVILEIDKFTKRKKRLRDVERNKSKYFPPSK